MAKLTVYPFVDWSASESDNIHPRRFATEEAIAEANGVKSGEGIQVDEADLDGSGHITIERLQMLKLIP